MKNTNVNKIIKATTGMFDYFGNEEKKVINMFDYFDGSISRDEAIELIKRNSRRYAKRQLTWFGRDGEIEWFLPSETEKIVEYIDSKVCTLK